MSVHYIPESWVHFFKLFLIAFFLIPGWALNDQFNNIIHTLKPGLSHDPATFVHSSVIRCARGLTLAKEVVNSQHPTLAGRERFANAFPWTHCIKMKQ